jgi:4-hydroxybenzoate polyprenyltransferase
MTSVEQVGDGSKARAQAIPPVPLVVDLDGTLVKSDLLIESLLDLLRKHPLCLFLLPWWLARGKARFKHEIGRRVSLNTAALPWRTEFIEDLRRQRAEGRSLVLATGSDARTAGQIADHLQLFDVVLATDGTRNLAGEHKRHYLVDRFGEKGFDYAASGERDDLIVWKSARSAILVNRESGGVAKRLGALRPRHWLKNLLVFVPLIAAHRFNNFASLERTLLAFIAFGLCASSGYLFNDLLDLESDRYHPQKRFRPFAAGDLPLSYALTMIPTLVIAAGLLSALVSPLLFAILAIYFAMSAAYSFHIKKVAVLDVLFLAGLYTVRIMAGSAAVGIWSSHWLLAFSIFLFFSLALVKRYGELVIMRGVDGDRAKARGYELNDEELLAAMGIASGYMAVLVLALYISSTKAPALYAHPQLLWLLCPLLLYWISYVWLISHRGKMQSDPVVFATSDRTSQILIILMAETAMLAI